MQAEPGQLPERGKLPGQGGTNIRGQKNSSFAAAVAVLPSSLPIPNPFK
ncbi:hypothetical protein [Sphaerospermopsis sp. LEGE 08334]|nr:hypothetical protein [Sphaerospermopsis sp. LEGE 08334]MBE9057306.1 hypothetical protein [Sphaerospermopsis sp. LEGE 08334]